MAENKYINLDKFLVERQEQGYLSFTFEELRSRFDLSEESLLQSIFRYKAKKQVAQIRKGFYAIITPDYSKQGMLPPYLFIDDLMKSLNKPYYIALLSAAALHGAAHQQPMEYFVVAQTPAPRSIRSQKIKLTFLSKSKWEEDAIIQKTSKAGYMNVSSPELTALDLLFYADKISLNSAVTVIQELVQEMKLASLVKTVKKYPHTAVIQRLGYILDKVLGEEKMAESLSKILSERSVFTVLLSIKKEKKGSINERWKIIENIRIESDL